VGELRGGVLVIDKPAGLTSHDVVHVVRRALGRPKVGHTGTLDPFATGVLPLVVGKATRLAQFYAGLDKEYEARVRFGFATDTYDGTGQPTTPLADPAALPGRSAVAEALAAFAGTHDQVPPAYSAKKTDGTPAYERARRGETVAVPPVRVTAYAVDLTDTGQDWATIRVRCGAGYYVRSLAHDLGQALGVGAHLTELRRLRCGDFRLADAVGLEPVLRDPEVGLARLVPLDALLPGIPAATLTAQGVEWVKHGRPLGPAQIAGPTPGPEVPTVRLLGQDGQFLAVADRREDGFLHPKLVLF
jgi:tRNA pseudouridine55 synthase